MTVWKSVYTGVATLWRAWISPREVLFKGLEPVLERQAHKLTGRDLLETRMLG